MNMQMIDLQNRAELFRGCVTPGVRMNEALLAFYADCDARVIRARAASGVQIAFVTDAVEMEYSIVCGGAARQIFTSDIFINGESTTVDGNGPHKFSMVPGEKKIIIHLPHLVVIEKITLAVNESAQVKVCPGKKKKLLFCGDSIMQGMTCTTPSKAVGALLAEKLDMELHNTSVGGADMRFEPVAETIAIGGDVLAVCFGINDCFHNTPPELFRERCVKVLELMKNFSGKSFIVVPIPNMKVDSALYESFCQIIRDEHRNFPEVLLIESSKFYPRREELFVDGTHPNNEGMKIYAEGLYEAVKEVLN